MAPKGRGERLEGWWGGSMSSSLIMLPPLNIIFTHGYYLEPLLEPQCNFTISDDVAVFQNISRSSTEWINIHLPLKFSPAAN